MKKKKVDSEPDEAQGEPFTREELELIREGLFIFGYAAMLASLEVIEAGGTVEEAFEKAAPLIRKDAERRLRAWWKGRYTRPRARRLNISRWWTPRRGH